MYLGIFKVQWLEILYKSHTEWVSIIKSFGEHKYAEDIVMETYLRLHQSNSGNKVVTNNKINRAFMWVTLRNNYVSYATIKSKVKKVEIKEYKLKHLPTDKSMYIANDILYDKIEEEISTWHWYDRDMFLLIMSGEVSMRKVSRDSRISLSSIANTINNCKKRLRKVIGEDYEDYMNKEFNRINE